MISEAQAFEKIERRRRQMHVHSTMYYYLNTSIIDDFTFDKWATELAGLQREFPQFKHRGYMAGVFANWTGDTGMHLPVTEQSVSLAQSLLRTAQNREAATTRNPKKKRSERWEGDVGYESL